MATEQALNIITGRTGTAHVSSADDAAIYRGFVGNNNAVLSTDQQLSLDYSTAGTLVVSDGVFCIGGRMGRISNTASVDYSLPSSGNYRRTILLVRYEYDSSDETESMTLMTLQSDPQSDTTEQTGGAASASVLPISVNQETDFVLYDFVCNEDGLIVSTLVDSTNVINNITELMTAIGNEQSSRQTADTALQVKRMSIFKESQSTRGVYFAPDSGNISTFLQNKKIIIIVFYSTNNQNDVRLQLVYLPFLSQPSAMSMITIGAERIAVEFQVSEDNSKIFLKCMTANNGVYVLSPSDYPFDAATVYAWE